MKFPEPFPTAIPAAEFLQASVDVLAESSWTADNSLACVALCRDELTRPFVASVQEAWGEAFELGGLAGAITCGTTGLGAALDHAPEVDERRRFVFYAMPHIGFADGVWGACARPGMNRASTACGALAACLGQWDEGPPALDPWDIEQTVLSRALHSRSEDAPGDLATLTRWAAAHIADSLDELLRRCADPDTDDYAVFTGVQIHGPRADWVAPGPCYRMERDERIALRL